MHFRLSLLLVCACIKLSAQHYANNWHLQFKHQDSTYGIGLLNTSIPNAKKTMVVAVIDDGFDIKHPALKNKIWVNKKEIPGNAVDDDHNGYIDDIHGWDFLGTLSQDISNDNYELTRMLRDAEAKFENRDIKQLSKTEKLEYKNYLALKKQFQKDLQLAQEDLELYQFYFKMSSALLREIDSANISARQLYMHNPQSTEAKMGYALVLDYCKDGLTPYEVFKGIDDEYHLAFDKVNFFLNPKYNSRTIIGDKDHDIKDFGYGNQNVMGPISKHGTHVAGIIAGNALGNGFSGISQSVEIMPLRAIPNGDERDKDIALAIRYAVDNGAQIINMSFAKYYSAHTELVVAAIRYAEQHNVLIVHAAGNENKNIDLTKNYPNAYYHKDTVCKTWIEVGASDKDLNPADFSNYGQYSVDVFAPGVHIYSCTPNNSYEAFEGSSMAAPVVAGLAALIWSQHPQLTAFQIKTILLQSVYQPMGKYLIPGSKKKKANYNKFCKTAGIVNAEKALALAASFK